MPVNKVIYGKKTLIDLTSDTVTVSSLLKGVTAHDKTGASIVGTYEPGTTTEDILERGFQNGNVTITDDGKTLTIVNNSTGQTLTKVFSDNKIVITLKSGSNIIGTLTKTYSKESSVITSVNSITGHTTVKTFDMSKRSMTEVVKDSTGKVIRSISKQLSA